MKRMDDGRYNKVANIVGHTMQFHPHGDASIGDALVPVSYTHLTDALQIVLQRVALEMVGTIEGKVLQEVSQTALVIICLLYTSRCV